MYTQSEIKEMICGLAKIAEENDRLASENAALKKQLEECREDIWLLKQGDVLCFSSDGVFPGCKARCWMDL